MKTHDAIRDERGRILGYVEREGWRWRYAQAIRDAEGDLKKAAKLLGLTRRTIYRAIHRHQLWSVVRAVRHHRVRDRQLQKKYRSKAWVIGG